VTLGQTQAKHPSDGTSIVEGNELPGMEPYELTLCRHDQP